MAVKFSDCTKESDFCSKSKCTVTQAARRADRKANREKETLQSNKCSLLCFESKSFQREDCHFVGHKTILWDTRSEDRHDEAFGTER